MPITLDQARSAKNDALATLYGVIPEINGVGITKVGDDYTISISLRAPLPPGVTIPSHIDGVPVVVKVVGPIRAL